MIEQTENGRATITDDFRTLRIEIPAKKNWFVIIFMCFWMCGWALGEVFALTTILSSDTPFLANAFLLLWVTLWTLGGIFVVYTILWQLVGKEIISLEKWYLKLEKSIFGIGRKRTFDAKSIKNMAINPANNNGWTNKRQNSIFNNKGKIKFDYGMKTIRFAGAIDEAEARHILELFKENPHLKEEVFAT